MEIEGRIILDLPLQQGTSKAGNPWRKKEWVLETFGQYPRKVCFNAFGDRIDAMQLELGKDYTVSIDIESREYNGRWYTDVRAFAARPYQPQYNPPVGDNAYPPAPGSNDPFPPQPQPQQAPAAFSQPQAPTTFTSPANDSEDLPF